MNLFNDLKFNTMGNYSENDLERFLEAQVGVYGGYAQAWTEVNEGRKMSHWIWYIFPQLRMLGRSSTATYYGIADRDEARRYLENPTLNERIREISKTLLKHEGKSAVEIFGEIDARKVRSCMTMFDCISPNDVFAKVLDVFYGGERCARTVREMQVREE